MKPAPLTREDMDVERPFVVLAEESERAEEAERDATIAASLGIAL
jgi:hypothetical protein